MGQCQFINYLNPYNSFLLIRLIHINTITIRYKSKSSRNLQILNLLTESQISIFLYYGTQQFNTQTRASTISQLPNTILNQNQRQQLDKSFHKLSLNQYIHHQMNRVLKNGAKLQKSEASISNTQSDVTVSDIQMLLKNILVE
ncbi:Hypothetical_protein [Hexamita inflata]|uniref:Hypothetical_protein n=1 Tax=Hexamita inflata TaxID=28002 RepID=A0ABP1HFW4_9EUKA